MKSLSELELVDQQVPDAHVERQQQVGRLLGRAQREQRAVRDLGEVDLAALGEQQAQLRHRGIQEREDRLERLPLRPGVGSRRRLLEGDQRQAQRLVA